MKAKPIKVRIDQYDNPLTQWFDRLMADIWKEELMRKEYVFYADGILFAHELMTLKEAQEYAKEFHLTFEEYKESEDDTI
jgi:hypothetical protein